MTAPQAVPRDVTLTWLRRFAAVPDPWVRLICFPHAGGGAGFYRQWRDHLPADVELHAVQYPGRADRIGEPCVDDMAVLASSVTSALEPLADRPFALFGHSLGAVIAFEVARRLCARVPGSVGGLFVSGRSAPSCQQAGTLHLAADDVLWAELGRLGGTRAQLLDDPELERLLLPPLRSDYRLDEAYQAAPGPPLPCPVTTLLGADDSEVAVEQARPWADYTAASFSLRVFPGGHFYLTDQRGGVIAEIMRRLAESVPPRPPGWAGP